MTLQFNGKNLANVLYNGKQLETLQLNGKTVWTKIPLTETIKPGTVIFESSKAGDYTVEIPVEGTYDIICVGAGGGSATYIYVWSNIASNWRSSSAAGGAGGVFRGTETLLAGEYKVRIGRGGTGYGGYSKYNSLGAQPAFPSAIRGGDGGLSSFDYIVSQGGKGGYAYAGAATGGAGGTGITSTGGKGGGIYVNSGVYESDSYKYINTSANGGSNIIGMGVGGGCNNSYTTSHGYTSWRANGGANGYIKITKA